VEGFFVYAKPNEPHFVALAKGQYNAGTLEKAAGTAIGTTKARARASAGTCATAQRTIND
jgi:hypothetical protein